MMGKYLKSKWENLQLKKLVIFNRISITLISVLLFLIWLIFATNNFYPKSETSFVAKIMNVSTQILIWPITLIILFIFIMPIWVTKSLKLLVTFLSLSLLILLFNFVFLFMLNINTFWILWLLTDIVSFLVIVFALFSVFYLHAKKHW